MFALTRPLTALFDTREAARAALALRDLNPSGLRLHAAGPPAPAPHHAPEEGGVLAALADLLMPDHAREGDWRRQGWAAAAADSATPRHRGVRHDGR